VSQWRKRCYEEGLDEIVSFTLDGNRRHGHAGAWPRHQLPMPRAHPAALESPKVGHDGPITEQPPPFPG